MKIMFCIGLTLLKKMDADNIRHICLEDYFVNKIAAG